MSKNQNIPTLEYPYNNLPASSSKLFPSPPLPRWLACLLDEPFSQSASIQIDRWLTYVAAEFEGVQS